MNARYPHSAYRSAIEAAIPMLGTMSDKALAALVGTTYNVIYHQRTKRKIPPYRKHRMDAKSRLPRRLDGDPIHDLAAWAREHDVAFRARDYMSAAKVSETTARVRIQHAVYNGWVVRLERGLYVVAE